jgi:leucyl/phenylalanyl-tRNA---protein transferase
MRDEGVFTVEDLLACYRMGVFPMGEARDDSRVFLVDPKRRGIIEPAHFHISHRLARTVRSDRFEIRVDTAFDQVVEACAETVGPGRTETWINAPIQILYGALFRRGQAHSVEAWVDGVLVGALYGVSLGGAFFGESMFSVARDASKVALVHLVARLCAGGYQLLDCQFMTDHLQQFGTVEISRGEYHARLDAALAVDGDFRALPVTISGVQALQAISQAS